MTLRTYTTIELRTSTGASEAANSDHHKGLLEAIKQQVQVEITRSYHQEIYTNWEESHRVENTVNITIGKTEEP